MLDKLVNPTPQPEGPAHAYTHTRAGRCITLQSDQFDSHRGLKVYDSDHPKVIPMDLALSHQVPSRPMTRARARALETEVTSLLSQLPFK